MHPSFPGPGAAQRKEKAISPEDPVTITVIRTDQKTTFRYWQLFLHQIFTIMQTVLVFFIFTSSSYNMDGPFFLYQGIFYNETFTFMPMVVGLTVAIMVLTYFYSTDTFILASCLFVTIFLHRQYPHQVPEVN